LHPVVSLLTFRAVLVWSDFGQNLCRTKLARALNCKSYEVESLPTIQHIPNIAFSSRAWRHSSDNEAESEKEIFLQTATSLPFHYGQRLDTETMSEDVFYLTTEMFRLVAASEAQFLLMMESKLARELEMTANSQQSQQKTLTLFDLDYNKHCLNRHIRQIQRLCSFVEARDDLDWPRLLNTSNLEQKQRADRAARSLLRDFASLLQHAKELSRGFDKGMDLLMNSAMIDESQRAIAQARRVGKLTALAFFFIPLSFTASVFGMNFKEFCGRARKHLAYMGLGRDFGHHYSRSLSLSNVEFVGDHRAIAGSH
jgi:Mg2+ and Co2+ transporter CorA